MECRMLRASTHAHMRELETSGAVVFLTGSIEIDDGQQRTQLAAKKTINGKFFKIARNFS